MLICLCGCKAEDTPNQLFIYSWFDVIPDEVIQQFEAETGIKVVFDYYDTNQVMEARLLTKKSGYDIVTPSAWPYAARQAQNGLFRKLDRTKIPNFKNLDPFVLKHVDVADPDQVYTIPYSWGVAGIAYNKKLIHKIMPDVPLDSWAMIFDPAIVSKFAAYGVCLLDDPNEVFMALESYLGLDREDWSAENTNKALQHMVKIKPYIQKFVSSQGKMDLAKGDAAISHNYTSDIENGQKLAKQSNTGVEIGFIIPKEGVRIWVDCLAIPIDSKNVDNAHKFINFMLRGEIAAKITNTTYFANANVASWPYLDKGIKDNPLIYPDEKLRDRIYTTKPMPRGYEKLLNRKLIQIMTGAADNVNVTHNKDSTHK